MATAKKLPSGNWRVRVYDSITQKYRSFTAPTKKEAEYLAAEYKMRSTPQNGADIRLYDAYGEYIESRRGIIAEDSIREYQRKKKSDFPELMQMKVSEITQDIVQNAVDKKLKTFSAKSVCDSHGLLSAVLKRHGIALHTRLPKKPKPKITIPTDEQMKQIVDKVKDTPMEIPVLLSAFGSLRRSEICALDQIDGNTIHVDKAMVMDEYRSWYIKPPKTEAGDRYVTLPDFVVERLQKSRLSNGRFTELNPNEITQRWAHVLKSLSIPHFKFHALRHYNASIMLALGVPNKYAAARGGWGSEDVMKQVYQHIIESKMNEVDIAFNDELTKKFA